jgi:ATP-binding cassette, subfamily B, bacterial PglK
MKQYLKEILYLLDEDKKKLPLLIFLFLFLSFLEILGIGIVGPYIALVFDPQALDGRLGIVINALGLPKERDQLLTYSGIILVAIFLVKAILAIFVNYKIIYFCQNQTTKLRSYLMRSYQHLPYSDYLQRNSSEYINSILPLVAKFSGEVVQPSLKLISDGIVAVAILLLLAWSNWVALLLLLILLGVLVFVYDNLFRNRVKLYGASYNKASASLIKDVNEGIDGFKEIRVLGNELYFYNKVRNNSILLTEVQIKRQVVSVIPRYLLELSLISFIVSLIIVTIWTGGGQYELLSTLGVFGAASLKLLPATNTLSSSLIQLRYGRDTVTRLYSDFQKLRKVKVKKIPHKNKQIKMDNFKLLTLEKINFSYPNTVIKALDNVDLTLRAGESIGFIGQSGAGKTTIVDILLGLLEPVTGTIQYNGEYLSDFMVKWRTQIAYLPQQVFLIDNTLRNNIALGVVDKEIDDERIEKALKQASLMDLIEQLPNGVNTVIGERGARLSGGQCQRIALARAFYNNRKVLIMDEATSALDNETEQEVVEEIKQLKGKVTMIVIAHRLSTVQHCDRIYKMEKGRIVDVGVIDSNLNFQSNK